jgi:hypothetical protein
MKKKLFGHARRSFMDSRPEVPEYTEEVTLLYSHCTDYNKTTFKNVAG